MANRAPGVHVEEVERGAKPIEGVSTSTVGFLGKTERGPTEPRLVTSYADFRRLYGGYIDDSYLAPAVEGFFTNGGGRAFIGRVTTATNGGEATLLAGTGGSEPAGGEGELGADPAVIDLGPSATSGDSTTVTVENLGESGHADIVVASGDLSISDDPDDEWTASLAAAGDLTVGPGETGDVTVDYSGDGSPTTATLTINHDGSGPPVEVALHAGAGVMDVDTIGPGEWGSHVMVLVDDGTMYSRGDNQLFRLTLRYWADDDDLKVAKKYHGDTDNDAVPEPDVEEEYDDLSPVPSASNFYESVVNPASNLVDLTQNQPGRPANTPTNAPTWLSWSDGGGGDIDSTTFDGNVTDPPNDRTGFAGFETVDDISIVCVPDENEYGLGPKIRQHCTEMGDRIGITQAPQKTGNPSDVSPPVNSDYTAFYYPWIEVVSSETGNEMLVPPGGHVAGIYARSDSEHGVHKAPANEVVRGARSLQFDLTDKDQAGLNARGINCIRSFRGRGIRVWGARTTSPDPAWKYLNVRRLFLYLRESIEEGTQWVVFESNDEDLWARVEQTIENFLTGVWEDGALMGTSPEDAFFVKCDRTTMTQNDIDNGRLVCEIGVAPVKPAEFVIFEISQWTGSAE
ncbi:MAG: phage tail sheath protein FI [Haloarculaceae archaeon]|jgi:phage tail sheath protein FI